MIPSSHQGRFVGPNRLWLMPGTPVNVSDGSLELTADRVQIRWAYEGAAKEGEIVLSGPASSCRGSFKDTFHAPDGMVFHGAVSGRELRLYGTFPVGDGSPEWGWRITLDWADPEHVTLRMFNVKPDGEEALAVDLRGSRASA